MCSAFDCVWSVYHPSLLQIARDMTQWMNLLMHNPFMFVWMNHPWWCIEKIQSAWYKKIAYYVMHHALFVLRLSPSCSVSRIEMEIAWIKYEWWNFDPYLSVDSLFDRIIHYDVCINLSYHSCDFCHGNEYGIYPSLVRDANWCILRRDTNWNLCMLTMKHSLSCVAMHATIVMYFNWPASW